MPFETFAQTDFAGLREDESPENLADHELVEALNCCRNGSSFGTRPGCERESAATGNYSAALASPGAVQGIVDYSLPFTAGIRAASTQLSAVLLVIHQGAVFTDSGTTLVKAAGVTITSPGATPNYWTFAQHKNVLYMAGGADGDTVNRWPGSGDVTKVTFQNAAAVDSDAKYIFQKWNYGFLGGMNGTGPEDNPMVVRYSPLGDMTQWPAGNTIGGTSTIGGFDAYGDNWITGFADYTDNNGDWLLVLTRRAIYGVQQYDVPMAPFQVGSKGIVANGCVHQRAFVSLGQDSGDAVYVSENGIHTLRQSQQFGGREDKFLSWKIRQTFANATKNQLQNSCGAYWPDEGLVLLAIPFLGGSENTLLLALDVRGTEELTSENARWYVWQLAGISVASITVARDTNGTNRVYFGTYNGNVLRFTRVTYDDLGTAYAARFVLKHRDYGRGDRLKGYGDIYTSLRPGGSYKPQLSLLYDRGIRRSTPYDLDMPIVTSLWDSSVWDGATWSESNQIVTPKQYGEGYGYTLSMEFSHSGANQPFFLTRVVWEAGIAGESGGDV